MTQAVAHASIERQIANLLIEMGRTVETSVNQAIGSLLNWNQSAVVDILSRERLVNEMELSIDKAVSSALANGTLSRSELKTAAAVLKINKDLERLGDLAANIARCMSVTTEKERPADTTELQPMAIATSHVCRQTLRALVRRDLVLANNVSSSSAAVQGYRGYAARCIGQRASRQGDITLLLASQYLEEMADLAVSLAENVALGLAEEHQRNGVGRQLAS
jgi:phosphate transport system protein